MATSQITRKDILARRRGRQFTHNAAEEVPDETKPDAGSDSEAQGDVGRGDPEGDFTARAAAAEAAAAGGGRSDDSAGAGVSDAAPAPQGEGAKPAQPTQPSVDDSIIRQALADRLALEQRLREREEALNATNARLAEFEARQGDMEALQSKFKETEAQLAETRRREFERGIEFDIESRVQKLLDEDTEGNLSHDTARALVKKVMGPAITSMMSQFNANEQRLNETFNTKLQETHKAFDSRISELTKQRQTDSLIAMNRAIQAKYPKFSELVGSSDFTQFGANTPRFSLDNYSTLLAKAYTAHDTDRVLEIMSEFDASRAGRKEALEGMADVAVGHVSANRPAAAKQEETFTYEDLGDARRKVQSGEMTREEFRKFKAKIDKAEKEGRIRG